MKKISNMFSKMKPKDWIMVSLWMLTLVFLFSFVGVVSGLSKKSGDVSEKAYWTFKLTDHGKEDKKKGSLTAMPGQIYDPNSKSKDGYDKDGYKYKKYSTKDEALKDKINKTSLTDDVTKDKNIDWTFDKLEPGKPSNDAKKAQNSIAAVALMFFLSLTAAIFGTAYIKYRERKAGK